MRALLLAFGLLAFFTTPASADRYALTYDAKAVLGVVPLGRITLDADIADADYRIAATLQSGGLPWLFEPTSIEAEATGLIANGAIRWQTYDLDHRYSRKHRVIALRAGEDGAVSAEITPNYRIWGDPPASDEQRARSRDPLSSLMAMAVDVGQTRRCSGAYPTFDGRFHYLLELSGGEIDDFDDGGYQGQVLKCTLAYRAVAGYERHDVGRRRIPHGDVWFALAPDSTFAPPVRISTWAAVIRLREWHRANVNITDSNHP